MPLHLSGDLAADTLLDEDPFALVVGMLLDQQMTLEAAFAGPKKLADRMGGLDVHRIAAAPPDEFEELAATPPAVHRYPRAMAGRIQELARLVIDEYDGDAANIWRDGDARTVLKRIEALPGFGKAKARIFLALLGKQRGLAAAGWREASAPYGDDGTYLSVADIVDKESLAKVREHKKAMKAQARATKA